MIVGQTLQHAFRMASRAVGSRPWCRALSLGVLYGTTLAASFYLAYALRWDFAIDQEYRTQLRQLLLPVVLCKLLLLASFGQFRSVLSYFGLHDLGCIVACTGVVSTVMFALWCFSEPMAAPSRGVILIDFILSIGGVTTARLLLRVAGNRARGGDARTDRVQLRVGIIGAGDMGSALVNDLATRASFGRQPVVLFDDDTRKWGRHLHGVPIVGPIARLPELVASTRITEVIITMPSAGPKKLKEVLELAQRAGLKTSIVPSFAQLASGEVRVDRFRPVEIEDLLGRKPANLDSARIEELVRGRVVMVTGAGGSIGSELCRQIVARGPRRLLLVEQSEVQLFQIEQELLGQAGEPSVVPLIADILDAPRLREIFDQHRPHIVFHAAAHKHVSMMERQPAEAVKNNFLGTAQVARIAREFEVGQFVLISSDKAINPTSVMGATKRLSEYVVLADQRRAGNRTAFMAVRFGNVLGSSGSVIPIFKRQIAAGGPVTVTHPEVTRYFMTIPEAVGLVLQAATMGTGGEVFVLDMGTPLKIVDVAKQLIELSGFRPGLDIEITFTGLRPGEKLFEEVQHGRENLQTTEHSSVLRLVGEPAAPAAVDECHAELEGSLNSKKSDRLKRLIQKWVPEYTPYLEEPVDAAPIARPERAVAPSEAATGTSVDVVAGVASNLGQATLA